MITESLDYFWYKMALAPNVIWRHNGSEALRVAANAGSIIVLFQSAKCVRPTACAPIKVTRSSSERPLLAKAAKFLPKARS